MKKYEIFPLGVYEGKPGKDRPGEQRKVLCQIDDEVKFEVVANPNPHWGSDWKVGSTHQIFIENFARWATKRIS